MKPCSFISLRCRNPDTGVGELPETVGNGMVVGECRVSLCIPNPCTPWHGTRIVYSKLVEYKVEHAEDDILIYEYVGGKPNELYVYPENMWRKVEKLYIEPLKEGQPVTEHLLLIGAPGTGKSVLAKLISRMLGVNSDTLRITEIRDKYYGESEKKLERKLVDTLRNEPTVLIIDDAEFLITSRSVASSSHHGTELTEIALRDILFWFLEKVTEEKRRILVVATTNFSPQAIDEAFIRGRRFGEPVFIPLPSFTALYRYALFRTGNEKLSVELAHRCVSRGLTIADLKSILRYTELGLEPEFRRLGGHGYTRLHSHPVPEIVENEALRKQINGLFSLDKDKPTTLYMNAPVEVTAPVVSQLLMNLRRPGLMITDPTFAYEFAFALDAQKAVGIVPTTTPSQVHPYIRMNTRQPLIFIGSNPPNMESYINFISIDELVVTLGNRMSVLVKALASYHTIEYTKEDLEKVDRAWRGSKRRAVEFLSVICNAGKVNEEVLGRLVMR